MEKLLTISGSPHIHTEDSIRKIMFTVVLAMVPAFLVSIYFFGADALRVTAISVITCVVTEYLIQKYLIKGELTIDDGSAIVTGILLAFNVPAGLPWWIVVLGGIFAIAVGKMAFGGIGKNPFNPALVGRVFLLISFPVQMTTWPLPRPLFAEKITDALTGPTPLGLLKEGLMSNKTIDQIMADPAMPDYIQRMTGFQTGSLGEMSAIALILGAIFMFYRKVITWHIPISYLLSAFLFAGVFWLIDPTHYADPFFHLFTGGLMLGIFYMATDMVSSPMSPRGQIVFGIGCGLLTMIIRFWGGYPEGVSFAILIMNAFTPLINSYIKPKGFGI